MEMLFLDLEKSYIRDMEKKRTFLRDIQRYDLKKSTA